MSAADMQFMDAMMSMDKQCIAAAKKYLANPPSERMADMTAMAKQCITDCTADMAKMAKMKQQMMMMGNQA